MFSKFLNRSIIVKFGFPVELSAPLHRRKHLNLSLYCLTSLSSPVIPLLGFLSGICGDSDQRAAVRSGSDSRPVAESGRSFAR